MDFGQIIHFLRKKSSNVVIVSVPTIHQTLNPKAKLITDKDPYLYNLRVGSFQQGQKHKRAMAVKTDILASNGVIHAIDTVI